MTGSLRSSLNTGLNNGLRQSISGGVNGLGFFRTASLDLQFASKKTLDDRVSGDNLVTFTRASSATYVGSDGLIQTATTDTPRFDHDPATLESLGLLIEEARTNLFEDSSYQDSNYLTVVGAAPTYNHDVAPDGTNTALLLPSGNNAISKPFTTTAAVTFSVWVKSAVDNVHTTSRIYASKGQTNPNAYTEFTTTNEWQRVSVTRETTGATATVNCQVGQWNNTNGPTEDILVWGAQVELASFPTSLIPTSGTTVTRAADVAEITGTDFSSWYNQAEGTLTFDYTPLGVIENKSIWGILGTSANNRLLVYADPSRVHTFYSDNGGLSSVTLPTPTVGVRTRGAYAFSQSDISAAVDGVAAGTTADTIATTMNKLEIGHSSTYNTSPSISAHIKRLAYFNTRLPDATLQSITS